MPMHFSAQSACHSPEYRSAAANAARKRTQTRHADATGRFDGPMRQADATGRCGGPMRCSNRDPPGMHRVSRPSGHNLSANCD